MNPFPGSNGPVRVTADERFLEQFPVPGRGSQSVFVGYPASYRVGMSNLGFHFLYRTVMRSGKLRVERFFADTAPYTLESRLRLGSAAALLFTVSYEEDYLNIARILKSAGIEARCADRSGRPIVIAGGPAVTGNPFPMTRLIDAFCLGDGENVLGRIVETLERCGASGPGELVGELARIDGVFVPSLHSGGASFAPPAGGDRFPASAVLTPHTVFPDTCLVEVGRGCPGRCSFCLARWVYRPYREMPLGRFTALLDNAAAGVDRVGLVSTAIAAHNDFTAIVECLTGRGIRVSFSSIRAQDIDGEKARLISYSGARTVSLAPESGSEALRHALGKRVPDKVYFNAAGLLAAAGVTAFNLYMLVGCPGECDASIRETEAFLAEFVRKTGRRRVTVHANVLVPKPWTPLQFHAVPRIGMLNVRIEALRKTCTGLGIGFKAKSVRSALRQAVLSLGDERAGDAIIRHVYDGISWKRALRESGIDPDMPHSDRSGEDTFPWEVLGGPTSPGKLREYFRGRTGEEGGV